MMRAIRRVMLPLGVAVVLAGAGSALLASPAFAGGVEDNGNFAAGVYNLTVYPWTLVAANTPELGRCAPNSCWVNAPAQTIAPGGGMVWRLAPNLIGGGGITFSDKYGYDGWMTYRVDVLGGPPEYVTIALSQEYSNGVFGNNIPALRQFITSAPPPASYDPGPNPDAVPAPLIASPQLTFQVGVPTPWDLTYSVTGDWTIDASSNQGQAFGNLLNNFCGVDANACSFTQQGLTWGIGAPGSPYAATNCKGGSGAQSSSGKAPGDEPNYFLVEYTASQSASLTVGGGVTVGTEFKLFDVIGNEISVSVEAEHEWEETKTFTRESKVYIPANDIAFVWVVPVVGKVTGTLVVSAGSAKFTVTNFSETRSGVSKDALTPAFNVITKVRPMTPAELKNHCGFSTPSSSLGASLGGPPVKPVPGPGLARVKLGQTQAQVVRALGQPLTKSFLVNPCQGLGPRCYAAAETGGRWAYRQLSVVFGPDLRVSGLIDSGAQRTSKGVGVGSSPALVRAVYPGVSCSRSARRMDCTLTGAYAGHSVQTVFRFMKTSAGRYKCDRVLVYLIDDRGGTVSS